MREKLLLQRVPSLEALQKWNLWLGIVFALQAIAIVVVGSSQLAPLTSSFLNLDSLRSTTSGSAVLAPATHHLFDLNLLLIPFIVMLVLAATHLSQATWYRARYESGLRRNNNLLRWLSYGLTANLLFVALAVLSGVYDIATLLLILVLGVMLHLLCLSVERMVGSRGRLKNIAWANYALLWLAGLGMWLIVVIYLLGDNVYGAGHIPARVYWLALSAAVTAACFAFGLVRQILLPKSGQRYRLTEQRYALLILLTSSLLVWQIVAGTMH